MAGEVAVGGAGTTPGKVGTALVARTGWTEMDVSGKWIQWWQNN